MRLEEKAYLNVGDYYCLDYKIKKIDKGVIAMTFAHPERVMLIPRGCYPTCKYSEWTNEIPYFQCLLNHRECRCPEHKLFEPYEDKVLVDYKYFLKQRGLK